MRTIGPIVFCIFYLYLIRGQVINFGGKRDIKGCVAKGGGPGKCIDYYECANLPEATHPDCTNDRIIPPFSNFRTCARHLNLCGKKKKWSDELTDVVCCPKLNLGECIPAEGGNGTCKLKAECWNPGQNPRLCGRRESRWRESTIIDVICCPVVYDVKVDVVSAPKKSFVCGRRPRSHEMDIEDTEDDPYPYDAESYIGTAGVTNGLIPPDRNSWPWMALLGVKNERGGEVEFTWFCGGVLINEEWVLTAAHCLVTESSKNEKLTKPKVFVVRLGEDDYEQRIKVYDVRKYNTAPPPVWRYQVFENGSSFEPTTTLPSSEDSNDYPENKYRQDFEFKVNSNFVRISPLYDPDLGYSDLALIKLNRKAKLSDFVKPACLPWGTTAQENIIGRKSTIAGWGKVQFGGKVSSQLLEAEVTIFDPSVCEKAYSTHQEDYAKEFPDGMKKENMICAGHPTGYHDTCQGDSGGPLVVGPPNAPNRGDGLREYMVVGIVSKGSGCGNATFPGLYAPVATELAWIKKMAFSAEEEDI